jgi:type I restriction enzyme S subunit
MRDGWVEYKLDDVTECSWGNTETTKSKYVDSGYLAYSASGADGFLEWFEHDQTAVVLSAIGAQCGKTWFAEGKWTSIKNTIWLKSDNSNLLDKYLYYLSNRDQFWQIRGQAQPFISLGDVKKTKVALPPLPEQKRIVDLISSVDFYIEALQQQLENAKRSRNAVLHELLTAGGDDWVETTLDGIAEYINGYPFKPADLGEVGLPVIRIKQLLDSNEPVDRTEIATPERCLLRDGDIVFSWSGTLAVRIWSRGPAKLNQHLFRVVEKKGVYKGIIPLILDHAIEELEEKSHGTTMKHITKQTLLPHKVFLPPLAEQKRIVEIMSSADEVVNKTDFAINHAKNLRSGLLSDLLSGEHEIPNSYDKVIGVA